MGLVANQEEGTPSHGFSFETSNAPSNCANFLKVSPIHPVGCVAFWNGFNETRDFIGFFVALLISLQDLDHTSIAAVTTHSSVIAELVACNESVATN